MGFLRHEPCPKCGSRDNLARYEDGGATCQGYKCEYWEAKGTDLATKKAAKRKTSGMPLPELGDYVALPKRGITEETCRKMKYSVGSYTWTNKESGERVTEKAHIVNVPDQDGTPVASKIRMAGKQFRYVGDTKAAGLVFQDVWPSGSSRKLVITEGEIDALSVCQIQGNKYAVVSLPNGVDSAVDVCGRSRDYLNGFEEIILMFDMDDPGKECARDVSRLFGDKVKIAQLGEKDANKMLTEGKGREVVTAIFNAQTWSPDGLVKLSSLREGMKQKVEWGTPWIYDTLTKASYGRRPGELYFIGAGAGIGKTDFCLQQIVADLASGEKSAMFLLEQPVIETGKRLAGKAAGKRFHIPPDAGGYTMEEQDAAVDALVDQGDAYLYDHFGAKDWDSVSDNIRWLALSEGVKHFWIDHLTALVSHAEDERRALEAITEEMSSLCQELHINLYVVSHLATPEGKPHEEGGRVMMRHFKGSRAIGFWGHFIFGLERDTQAENETIRQTTIFRVVKDRYTGQANGVTFPLGYNVEEGRQFELNAEQAEAYAEAKKGGKSDSGNTTYNEDF